MKTTDALITVIIITVIALTAYNFKIMLGFLAGIWLGFVYQTNNIKEMLLNGEFDEKPIKPKRNFYQ
jgi:hypothetical protein